MSAKEIVALGGIFRGFRSVYGDPPGAFPIKLGPAVVSGNVAFTIGGGKREANFKACGNAGRTHPAYQEGMKIRAITTFRSAGPNGVTPAPILAGLVLAHRCDNVVVDVLSLGKLCGVAGGMLFRQIDDDAIEWNKFVGLQIAFQRRVFRG